MGLCRVQLATWVGSGVGGWRRATALRRETTCTHTPTQAANPHHHCVPNHHHHHHSCPTLPTRQRVHDGPHGGLGGGAGHGVQAAVHQVGTGSGRRQLRGHAGACGGAEGEGGGRGGGGFRGCSGLVGASWGWGGGGHGRFAAVWQCVQARQGTQSSQPPKHTPTHFATPSTSCLAPAHRARPAPASGPAHRARPAPAPAPAPPSNPPAVSWVWTWMGVSGKRSRSSPTSMVAARGLSRPAMSLIASVCTPWPTIASAQEEGGAGAPAPTSELQISELAARSVCWRG